MARVLVIDDELLIRDTVQEILESVGFDVEQAGDGREGLDRLRRGGFDLLICDILMPEVDGIELIASARGDFPDLPVVAVTGGGRTHNLDFLRVAEKAGATATLGKPFTAADLLKTISTVLRRA